MKFEEIYEPIVRMDTDAIVSLGWFDSYEEANDAALRFAASELPKEKVKAYQILKQYINVPMLDVNNP